MNFITVATSHRVSTKPLLTNAFGSSPKRTVMIIYN